MCVMGWAGDVCVRGVYLAVLTLICVFVCHRTVCTVWFGVRVGATAARASICGPGPLPADGMNMLSVRHVRPALIPTRTAGGECVPDQLYHCTELSHREEKVTQPAIRGCSRAAFLSEDVSGWG